MTDTNPWQIAITPTPFTWRVEHPGRLTGYNPNSLTNWAKGKLRTTTSGQAVHLEIWHGPTDGGGTDTTLGALASGTVSLSEPANSRSSR